MIRIEKRDAIDVLDDPQFDALIEEYAEECSISDMPPINYQRDIYLQLESVGILHAFAAYDGGKLIGFMSMILSVLPHYGALTATTESVFVAKGYRKGSTGIKLIRAGEQFAESVGAVGILLSAPANGVLSVLAPRIGYRKTNEVFFRRLNGSGN